MTFQPLLPRRRALALIPATLTALYMQPASADGTVELTISSDGEFLAFTPDELTCRTGGRVRVVFHHTGERLKQDHNWVLLKPGTEEAFIKAAFTAGDAKGWMPPGDKRVIAATPLCGPGMTAMAEFTSPAPGNYPFLCSFAGHGEEMRGMLHVTA